MTPTPPGLDLTTLRALRRPRPLQTVLDRIGDHLDHHDGYVPFSGGKDSTVVVDLARRVDPAVPVVWFDSGLELPETRPYIETLATRWRLNLTVITPTPTLLEILIASGAWDHTAATHPVPDLGRTLIEIPAAHAHALFGPGELWGVRSWESAGRRTMYFRHLAREITAHCHHCCPTHPDHKPTPQQRARHGGIIRRRDGTTAYGPIWDWTTDQVWTYLAHHNIPTHPAYAKLRALGAPEHALRVSTALDGDHLDRGRITWLRHGWPHLYTELATALPRITELT